MNAHPAPAPAPALNSLPQSAHSSFQDGVLCIVIPKLQAKTTAAAKKKTVTSIPIATPLEHEENKRKKLIRDLKGKFKSNK